MVELEDAMVCYAAVCAFAVQAFVSVHECFVSGSLVSVLHYACLGVLLVPPCGAFCWAFLTGWLQSVCFAFVLGVFCCGFHLTAYRTGFRAVIGWFVHSINVLHDAVCMGSGGKRGLPESEHRLPYHFRNHIVLQRFGLCGSISDGCSGVLRLTCSAMLCPC